MHRKVLWSLGLGVVGLMMSQKQTYWAHATRMHDIKVTAVYGVGGLLAGLLIANMVVKPTDTKHRLFRICYWMGLGGITGLVLLSGSDWTPSGLVYAVGGGSGLGLICGVAQYVMGRAAEWLTTIW